MNATLGQALQILQLITQKRKSRKQLEALIDSGVLSDILEADWPNSLLRSQLRRMLGLPPVYEVQHAGGLTIGQMVKRVDYRPLRTETTRGMDWVLPAGKYDLRLVRLGTARTFQHISDKLKDQRLSPVGKAHLLALSMAYERLPVRQVISASSCTTRPGAFDFAAIYVHGVGQNRGLFNNVVTNLDEVSSAVDLSSDDVYVLAVRDSRRRSRG